MHLDSKVIRLRQRISADPEILFDVGRVYGLRLGAVGCVAALAGSVGDCRVDVGEDLSGVGIHDVNSLAWLGRRRFQESNHRHGLEIRTKSSLARHVSRPSGRAGVNVDPRT
jgi:hypothetical protein